MFTPIRVAAVTAVLALSGTLALVSGPLAPAQPVTAPGAESSVVSMAPAHFTGTVHAGGGSEVETETLPDRIIERYEVSYRNVMSDERLSGQGVGTNYDETIIGGDGAFYIVHASTGLLENEGGAWALTCDGVGDTGASSLAFIRCWYDGQAGYEGLTAFSILSSNDAGPIWDVTGWVFPGDQPLAP